VQPTTGGPDRLKKKSSLRFSNISDRPLHEMMLKHDKQGTKPYTHSGMACAFPKDKNSAGILQEFCKQMPRNPPAMTPAYSQDVVDRFSAVTFSSSSTQPR
jgi:hypothetical protein